MNAYLGYLNNIKQKYKNIPSCCKWTVHATKARWFGDVHVSVEK